MQFTNLIRQHTAALRALLVLTVILGLGYPVFIWALAQFPGLRDHADGSVIEANGKPVGSSLIGQLYTDADGNPLPQYFQGRPSAAGDGYDPMATSASNLGPESIVDRPDDPSLLTQVCRRSKAIADLDGADGSRPFCTDAGVGAVLSVLGTRVISVNEPCATTTRPFLDTYAGMPVQCAEPGVDYRLGRLVPIRGNAPSDSRVPADAVTSSGSGLDPDISPHYAELQAPRVAEARGLPVDQVRRLVSAHTDGRTLGFLGEPRVNVLELNIALDKLSARG